MYTLRRANTSSRRGGAAGSPVADVAPPALDGVCVLITGGAGGLGGAIAAALARRGARLLLADVDEDRLAAAGERHGCAIVVADVATAEGRARMEAACVAMPAPLDVLVNSAGIEKAARYDELDEAEVRHAIEVNLLGSMLLTRDLLGGMRARGRGHVISVASMAGVKPVPYNAVYNTAKAGLVAFSTSLSKELRGSGVAATVICPSAVTRVGMWARVSAQLPRNRLVESSTVTPEAVAAAVLHALARRPARVLVASRAVRAGALLSALSPTVDRLTDRVSRIEAVYRERIRTDSGRRL